MWFLRRGPGLALLLTVAACASGATSESATPVASPPLTNVVTLSPVADAGLRRTVEDELARQLSRHGVRAVPAHAVLADQDLASRDRIVSVLRAKGFDGVVAMRLVSADQKLTPYPGFDAYWGAGGQVIPETVVRVEVNAYSLVTNQLVTLALSKSDAHEIIASVSRLTSDQLAKDRVIGRSHAPMR